MNEDRQDRSFDLFTQPENAQFLKVKRHQWLNIDCDIDQQAWNRK